MRDEIAAGIRNAMEHKTIKIFGEGSQLRDYIYIDDLIDLFIEATKVKNLDKRIFNAACGNSVPFSEMVKTVVEVVGRGKVENVPWPENYEKNETGNYIADISAGRKLLRWSPKVSLKEGIRLTYDYYLKHKDHYF